LGISIFLKKKGGHYIPFLKDFFYNL
jgi:hypothetical protein